MKNMLRILSICLLLMIFSIKTFSSDYGVKGGLSLVNWNTSEPLTIDDGFSEYNVDLKNLVSWQAGAFVNFSLTESFFIQPEVYYVTRGFKVDQIILGIPFIAKIRVSYLEIPLLFKYKIPVNLSLKPVLFAGSYMALRLSAKRFVEFLDEKIEKDVKDEIKGSDFGLIFGIGSEYKIGSVNLIFDAISRNKELTPFERINHGGKII